MYVFRLLPIAFLLVACGGARGASSSSEPDGDVLNSVTADELFEDAIAYGERGDLQRSEQYFVASMERGKSAALVIPYLVRLCVSQRRFSGALNYLEPLLQHEPHRWRLRRLYATLLAGLGRNQEAETEFHRVLDQAPRDATTHYFMGMFYRDLSRQNQAKAHLLRYLEYTEDARHRAEVEETLLRFEEWENAQFQAIGARNIRGGEPGDSGPSPIESEQETDSSEGSTSGSSEEMSTQNTGAET